MAKKTKADVLKCPIDYLYLWASDQFISQLGSKVGKIIKTKKYNQYQTLYKTVVENESAGSASEYLEIYNQWTTEIAAAIKDTYGITPAQILVKLAMGEEVLGKNFKAGVYGIGEAATTTYVQDASYSVDPNSGKILINGIAATNQTPIYGSGGNITGYSYTEGGYQYQSSYQNGQYIALSYSNSNGAVQTANGMQFDFTKGSFWQNANNYMPIVNAILSWVSSIVNSFYPNRTLLTAQNTVPQQSEWIEVESENNNGLLIAGGILAAGVLIATMGNPFDGKKSK